MKKGHERGGEGPGEGFVLFLSQKTRLVNSPFSAINILTWLRGFQDKLLYLVFSLYQSLFWELRNKEY